MNAPSSISRHIWLVICGALAGGLGWGIRGQYGHESGAMMAGLLVSSVIAVGYLSHLPSLFVARAMALTTIAIGIGGSLTYGQTIGLTHDKDMVGNWEALRWGMLGLGIKGSIWIGFAGMMLGHALSGRLLGSGKMLLLIAAMWAWYLLGVWLINQPYDPARRLLPDIYFSADWYWRPDAGPELKPRREVWGGLGLALLLATLSLRLFAHDRLAMRLAGWGMLGGALGFPAGQCFQAYHAWHLASFQTEAWQAWDRVLNWWNIMETTFGCIMGACLTIGIIFNRNLIDQPIDSELEPESAARRSAPPLFVSLLLEGCLLTIHLTLLVNSELIRGSGFGWYSDGLIMAALPFWAVSIGRFWPYFLLLPVTAIPIAGKTFLEMAFVKTGANNQVIHEAQVSWPTGMLLFLVLPITFTVILASLWSRPRLQSQPARRFVPWLLLTVTWLYFGLNFAFFQFPFPWSTWTARTPNAIFYFVAAVTLSILSLSMRRRT